MYAFNSKKGVPFTKWCCDEPTHFPKKMKNCEDLSHDAAAALGGDAALDAIITVGPVAVTDVKVFGTPEMPIYDHTAIQCRVNGLTLFSLNMEGRCNMLRNEELYEMRWEQLKAVVRRLDPFPDLFCLQELFLRSNMPRYLGERRELADALMRELLDEKQEDFIFTYDDFTGGTIVNKKYLLSDRKMVYDESPNGSENEIEMKNYAGVQTKHRVRHIARYGDPDKKCTVVHVHNGVTSFYVVNVHLKAVQTILNGELFQQKEVSNLLANLQEEMRVGVVFIGDHNTTHPEKLYAQAGGKKRFTSKRRRKKINSL
jgi:hypothetical protein